MNQDYKSLLETVKHHAKQYYDNSTSLISDEEYDELYDKLAKLEDRQGWRDSSSPTLKVGYSAGKVKHPYRLYSLKKVYEERDVDREFSVKTPKLDGANLSLTYNEDGSFRHALTRGDGEYGEDVSHLVSYIACVKPSITTKSENPITFVGEVVTDKDVENFRNYVSGSLGVKNAEDIKHRELRFIVHDVLGVDMDYPERINLSHNEGFITPFSWECDKYPQDGIVFRTASHKREKVLGHTSKYPRFAVALKVRAAMTAVTTIQSIVWSLGRTGVVTPVAVIDPVTIDDATISRVILHNIEFIEEHELGPGDEIVVERQITPQFVKVLSKSSFPRFCVDDAEKQLGMTLKRQGPKLFASVADSHKSVEYFVKQLGIKGLGPKWIEKLSLKHPTDLFSENTEWEHMGRNGDKVLEELSRPKPYETVLASLGIPGVGKSTAKTITSKIPNFNNLRDIQYQSISGIGPKTVESILAWLDVNEDWVHTLPYDLSKEVYEEDVDIKDTIIVAVSGKIDMTKQDLKDHLAKYKIIVKDSVTKDVNYLISSGESTSKVVKAEKYGIPIINYWENKTSILKGELHG